MKARGAGHCQDHGDSQAPVIEELKPTWSRSGGPRRYLLNKLKLRIFLLDPNILRGVVGLMATILITRKQNEMTINFRRNQKCVQARRVHESSVNRIYLVTDTNPVY